jgi:hypothetical protein
MVGCLRTITPAEIRQLGTKPFPGHGRIQVAKASVAALKVLGFQVVADHTAPRIRTAPKLIQVYAAGTAYSVTTTSDALAWSIEVTQDAKGSLVHAEPRAYRNGQPLDFDQVGYDYMDRAFTELYREIDDNLKGKQR